MHVSYVHIMEQLMVSLSISTTVQLIFTVIEAQMLHTFKVHSVNEAVSADV